MKLVHDYNSNYSHMIHVNLFLEFPWEFSVSNDYCDWVIQFQPISCRVAVSV